MVYSFKRTIFGHGNGPKSDFGSVSFFFQEFVSRFFGSVSSFFWVSFWFSEKVLNSQFVDRFPLFLGPFPLFLGPFPIFRKSCKFSVC